MFATQSVVEQELSGRKSAPVPHLRVWQPAVSASPVSVIQRKDQCACGGGCPRCKEESAAQTKLRVSQPGDAYEQEADRVAESVMRMPESGSSEDTKLAGGPQIRRMSAGESEVHRQAADEAEEEVSATEEADEDGIVPDETGMPKLQDHAEAPGPLNHIPRQGGRPLDSGIRNFMEQRFSSDFGHVQLHTDREAAASADKLNAHAYTVGRDIYFNNGQYDPGTHSGKKLLAHELTHVLQQTGSGEELGVQRRPRTPAAPAPPACVNTCNPGSCPQGKQRRVIRNDCGLNPEPINPDNYISALNVSLSAQTVQVIWSGLIPGNTEVWPCSPHPSNTPRHSPEHPDVVGNKCSINHTNRHKDGMAWFTGFASEGLRIGFHDSQKVGAGCVSHGCVRVCCDKAETINKNSWGGRTTITVT
jgi:hypothetical protein